MFVKRLGLLAALTATLLGLAAPAFAQSSVGGRVSTSAPTYVDGETRPISLSTAGALRVTNTTTGASAQQVQGASASGAASVGNPVGTACAYNATMPTAATGQRIDCQADAFGQQRVRIGTNIIAAIDGVGNANMGTLVFAGNHSTDTYLGIMPVLYNGATWDRQRGDVGGAVVQPGLVATHWSYAAASGGISNTTTAVTIKTAAGAGVRNCIASFQLFNGTLGAATEVAIRDGAAGTVIWRGRRETVASSEDVVLPVPICGTANTLLEVVTLTATVTGGVYVNAQGFTRP